MDNTHNANSDAELEETSQIESVTVSRSRNVRFYDDELLAVQATDNAIYVPLRRLCQNLKLSAQAQTRRIRRSDVLDEGLKTVSLDARGVHDTLILRADLIPLWLSGVSTSRIQDAQIRQRLILYQRECARVLWNEFAPALPAELTDPSALAVASPDTALDAMDDAGFSGFGGDERNTQALVQIRENALAIARLADEQLAMQERLNKAAEVVGKLKRQVTGHEKRLTVLEGRLQPTSVVSTEQAQIISTTVKALAEELTRQMPGGTVHYNAVFTELYRRFGVASYKSISVAQYPRVLQFLEDWRIALVEGIELRDRDADDE